MFIISIKTENGLTFNILFTKEIWKKKKDNDETSNIQNIKVIYF
jgi:hypothetical protein